MNEPAAPPPIQSETAPAPPALAASAAPRIWTALVVGVAAPGAAILNSIAVITVIVLLLAGPAVLMNPSEVKQWIIDFGSTPGGLVVMVVPGQIIMLVAAFGAAAISSQTFRQRLAIVRPSLPYWSYPFLMVGTLAAGMIGAMLAALLPQADSDQLRMVYTALAGAAGWQLVMMLLVISVVPGVVEESLFRGYVQSRLLRRWPPVLAIAFSTLVFALAHFDPVHVVAVIPIGIWLGVVAWRAGSIIPAILCHAFNNAVALLTAGLATEETIDSVMELPIWVLIVCGVSMVVSIGVFFKIRSA